MPIGSYRSGDLSEDSAGDVGSCYVHPRKNLDSYETTRNLEAAILDNRTLITAAPVGRTLIAKRIRAYGTFSNKPATMQLDRDSELYYEQFEERYVVQTSRKTDKQAVKRHKN